MPFPTIPNFLLSFSDLVFPPQSHSYAVKISPGPIILCTMLRLFPFQYITLHFPTLSFIDHFTTQSLLQPPYPYIALNSFVTAANFPPHALSLSKSPKGTQNNTGCVAGL